MFYFPAFNKARQQQWNGANEKHEKDTYEDVIIRISLGYCSSLFHLWRLEWLSVTLILFDSLNLFKLPIQYPMYTPNYSLSDYVAFSFLWILPSHLFSSDYCNLWHGIAARNLRSFILVRYGWLIRLIIFMNWERFVKRYKVFGVRHQIKYAVEWHS